MRTIIFLAAALLTLIALAPAHAYWEYRTVRIWHPDRARYYTSGESRSQLCQDRARRAAPLPPTWWEAAAASRDREIVCNLRHGVRTYR